ncbi:MAG: 30S ribosomal protein S6 [Alicyclobacillaceae bacterium]|nr:30S ribosomal protein S6 [Alicyclobacillaceae bacterium]
MRNYEALYVLRPDLDEEATAEQVQRFSELVTNQGGEVKEVNTWGKRRLAYEIQGFRDGYYVLMKFAANTELPKELERVFRISEPVIRYIVVRDDE